MSDHRPEFTSGDDQDVVLFRHEWPADWEELPMDQLRALIAAGQDALGEEPDRG